MKLHYSIFVVYFIVTSSRGLPTDQKQIIPDDVSPLLPREPGWEPQYSSLPPEFTLPYQNMIVIFIDMLKLYRILVSHTWATQQSCDIGGRSEPSTVLAFSLPCRVWQHRGKWRLNPVFHSLPACLGFRKRRTESDSVSVYIFFCWRGGEERMCIHNTVNVVLPIQA